MYFLMQSCADLVKRILHNNCFMLHISQIIKIKLLPLFTSPLEQE